MDVAVLVSPSAGRGRARLLVLDGDARTVPATLVAVGNTSWYGAGMRIRPGADLADGRFDVTVVGPQSRPELVRSRTMLTDGSLRAHPSVSVHRASRVELATEDVRSYADGEPVAPLPAVTECVPGALTVVGTGRR